jgi:C4-dicarboxylate transporter DctM subunit
MSEMQIGLLYGATTFLFMFSGMPIAFAVGTVALIFMFFFMPLSQIFFVAETIYSELNNFTLLTIPLFILMGAAIGKSRAGADLYGSLNRWLYKVPGGLGIANTVACSIFAAMCGSSPATCAAIGSSGIPQMRERGYSNRLATGIIAAGGTLGILIPPSLTLILYGLAAEQSIGKLFMGGFGPGLLLTVMFCLWVMFSAWRERREARAGRGHANSAELLTVENYSWRERLATLPRLLPFLILILLIMIALYGGWATPSEVAGIGAFGALVMVILLYDCWRWRDMKFVLSGTARESSMIMMIIGMSFLYTYVMSLDEYGQMGVPLLGEHTASGAGLPAAARGDCSHGHADYSAGIEGVKRRPHLVRCGFHHQHGDRADHAAHGSQSVRDKRYCARHTAQRYPLGFCAVPTPDGDRHLADVLFPGDHHVASEPI